MQYWDYEHHFPRRVLATRRAGSELHIQCEDNHGQPMEFTLGFFAPGLVRVRLWRGKFAPPAFSPVREEALAPEESLAVTESGGVLEAAFGGHRLQMGLDAFFLRVLNAGGDEVCRLSMKDVNSVLEGRQQVPPLGYSLDETGRPCGMDLGLALRQDEHIYGLGERFTGFDKNGQTVTMRNFDTLGCRDGTSYINIPFCLSSYGYGLYVNSHEVFDFNVGTESVATLSLHAPPASLEFFLIFGADLKAVLSTYVALTGPAKLPPAWSFGLWHSNGFKGSSRADVEADAARYRAENIPVSVMHFDCYWLREDMWCDFVWDDAHYPRHTEMLAGLKAMGLKVCLWTNPYVSIASAMYPEGEKGGYFVKNAAGAPYTSDLWHGLLPLCAMVDFTNPAAVSWYQSKVLGLLREGVDALKTDFGEDIPEDAVFHNGMSGLQMRNAYSRLYNQAVFAASEGHFGPGNAMVWARSGCAGMQAMPVCWSGDPYSSYEGMAATLRAGLSLAMSGVPFWSHDMGGFYGDIDEEIFVRWCQMGLFASHSRLHGVSTRQPWAYGPRAQAILTRYIRLRYALLPYILRTAAECVQNGLPFLRPLALHHPDDATAAAIADEYYFGEALLVAPVFGGDGAVRKVYLPEGNWQGLLDGQPYAPGWHHLRCPLEELPVFHRQGQALEMDEEWRAQV